MARAPSSARPARRASARGVAPRARPCCASSRRAPISRHDGPSPHSATVAPIASARIRSSIVRPGKRVSAAPIASGKWASLPPVSASPQTRLRRRAAGPRRRAGGVGLASSMPSGRDSAAPAASRSSARRPALSGTIAIGCATIATPPCACTAAIVQASERSGGTSGVGFPAPAPGNSASRWPPRVVSSTPGMTRTALPDRAAASCARRPPRRSSWSVTATMSRPVRAARSSTSSAVAMPSLASVWTCRSARPRRVTAAPRAGHARPGRCRRCRGTAPRATRTAATDRRGAPGAAPSAAPGWRR